MIWSDEAGGPGPQETGQDTFAAAAVEPIESGMTVGLGAGKTAGRALAELARRCAGGTLKGVTVVPASDAAETMCVELGLTVAESSSFETVDVLIDGADEVDDTMRMLKGSRGAVARERIIAAASPRRIYLVPEAKVSTRLGENASLAIAVMPFGIASTRQLIREIGLNGVLRPSLDGGLLITDNGNLILDVALPEGLNLVEVDDELRRVPGVIEHGLFLDEADEILIEQGDGSIRRLRRVDDA
ncbi:MAG: ribose 5-phosphate isomerase A [Planctomycetota bacterium]